MQCRFVLFDRQVAYTLRHYFMSSDGAQARVAVEAYSPDVLRFLYHKGSQVCTIIIGHTTQRTGNILC